MSQYAMTEECPCMLIFDVSALTPLLQFNNIAFRISRVHNAKSTDPIHFCCCNVSHRAAAGGRDRQQRVIHVLDPKCNMTEPALVWLRQSALDHLIVAENLKRRSVIVVAGQTQVKAGKMRVPKRGDTVEPCAGHIAFGARGFASEHLAIESN